MPWGEKAFAAYLGDDREAWRQWDATAIWCAMRGERLPLLVDQGDADEFLATQLGRSCCARPAMPPGHPLELRMQPGYDHSYYFIASFIGEHIAYHAAALHRTL